MNWKIWYDDDTTVAGATEEEWSSYNRDGILIIREYGYKSPLVHMGMDYYWFENSQIMSCNLKDLHGYLRRLEGLKNVKFGRWCNNDLWKKVHDEAMIP